MALGRSGEKLSPGNHTEGSSQDKFSLVELEQNEEASSIPSWTHCAEPLQRPPTYHVIPDECSVPNGVVDLDGGLDNCGTLQADLLGDLGTPECWDGAKVGVKLHAASAYQMVCPVPPPRVRPHTVHT